MSIADNKEPVAEEELKIDLPPPTQESKYIKKCPMCGGEINYLIEDAKWMCYTCGHEEEDKT